MPLPIPVCTGVFSSPTGERVIVPYHPRVEFTVRGEVVEWRGPSPYHFVVIAGADAESLRDAAPVATYGWGMIPVTCTVGATGFTTSLWPRKGTYWLPLKDAVRDAEDIRLGDTVDVAFTVQPR